jgi:HEAT repeat protein
MDFVSKFVTWLGPAEYVLAAVVGTGVIIALLLAFILLRRAQRLRLFSRRDRRTLELRRQWDGIVQGSVPPESWRFDPLSRAIVETILADQLEVATAEEARPLLACLRDTGLLDTQIHEARNFNGWKRRQALVSLGRMRAPEAIPALAEALDSDDPETRVAALRGLGRMELPDAAVPILDRLVAGTLAVPERPLLNALLRCCRARPGLLLSYVGKADDKIRPALARVLGEIATAELDEDLLLLASDALPEVRASAARALATAKPRLALTALAHLASDEQWFVRLRAVVGLGDLGDARAIPVLIDTLCDRNRYVRLRSAAALARMESHLDEILDQVVESRDRYALQAFISELERLGTVPRLIDALTDTRRKATAEAALLGALRAGIPRILLGALTRHPQAMTRKAVARLLASSRDGKLIAPLERMHATARTARERRLSAWVLFNLHASEPVEPAPSRAGVAA